MEHKRLQFAIMCLHKSMTEKEPRKLWSHSELLWLYGSTCVFLSRGSPLLRFTPAAPDLPVTPSGLFYWALVSAGHLQDYHQPLHPALCCGLWPRAVLSWWGQKWPLGTLLCPEAQGSITALQAVRRRLPRLPHVPFQMGSPEERVSKCRPPSS